MYKEMGFGWSATLALSSPFVVVVMQDKYVNPFTDFGFKKLFGAAQIACFNPAERQAYEDSLKYYRDL